MATQFGFAKDPESPEGATPVSPAETTRSLGRALKEDSPPFMFAGALVVGAVTLYNRVFGKKTRKLRKLSRLVRR